MFTAAVLSVTLEIFAVPLPEISVLDFEKITMKQNTKFNDGLKLLATKKRVAIITASWLVGIVLLLLAATDLFTQSPFRGQYLPMYLLMLGSTLMTARLWWVYLKTKD